MKTLHHYTSVNLGRQIPRAFSLGQKTPWWNEVLNPRSELVQKWNFIFFFTCMIALFLDPIYFYLPVIAGEACITVDNVLGAWVTIARTFTDSFFLIHIFVKCRTAFVSPSSRIFGRGDLVTDRRAIAIRYLKSSFILDVAAALPLPQMMIWFVIPGIKNPTAEHQNHTVALIVLIQYIPRFFVLLPLNKRIVKTTGGIAKTAWSGAAYNLLLYVLASHILGASWYIASIQRQHECWEHQCNLERNSTNSPCRRRYFDCSTQDDPERQAWLSHTHLLVNCDARKDNFQFGIFADALTSRVAQSTIVDKFFYCLWWGLRNLSSYGQSLMTSTYEGETMFSIGISITGLVLFAHLIGNMQTYMQSTTARLEEWKIRRRDTEEWMRHRQLPLELQERVRRFVQYTWLATRGVDEESILNNLPLDLRRGIQRHLCLALVRRVPFFAQMDDQLLDAICERLVSSLNTKDTHIVREGDPVNEMLFIIRGQLESSTTDGGRTGFFNSITLRPGDFCGEELLTWALLPTSRLNLPLSTRTVKALTEVEAFALRADDLKYVAKQFKRLHSKKLQHAFRYYSHQWRTWGACILQVAWRRHVKKKLQLELLRQENMYTSLFDSMDEEGDDEGESSEHNAPNVQQMKATMLASKFAINAKKVTFQTHNAQQLDEDSLKMPTMFKPQDLDYYYENEET